MWSQILLCTLVGLALASNNPAWKDNSEYVYQVRARTLASLNQISNDYSGIVLKAKLTVRPRSDGNVDGQISEAQYAQIHHQLEDGWDQEIPASKLSYKELPISSKPFQMVMHEGAVRNLIVEKEIRNWEANVIKSIVSQLQLDTKAKNLIPSHINILTQDGSNTAVYKTMEETVTGVSETLYEIHPLPEYVLQTTPWLAPLEKLRGDGEVIEVVRTKNFTNSEQNPAYYFGLNGIHSYEPANKIGDFCSRTSVSRAVITGDLNRFTIQSSVTVDQIVLSPTMNDQQKGSVNTMVNVTLLNVLQQNQRWEQPSNPVKTGLVYRFNQPYESSNQARPAEEYDHDSATGSAEANDDSRENSRSKRQTRRHPHNLPRDFGFQLPEDSSEQQYWQQEQPHLNEAPDSPLLPFTVGYDGQSIKKQQNIVDTVRKLAQKIGQEVQHPQEIPSKNTVGKFLILTSLLRTMDPQEMQQVASQLYSNEKHGQQAASWKAYRDAVAQAGTGPALITIKEWIKSNKISEEIAAQVVATTATSARQPTEEYMKAFFELIQSEDIMQHRYLNDSALLSYTNLLHQVYVNRDNAHNKYPVHSFGPFRTSKGKQYLHKVVIPYLTQQLNEAVAESDTQKIHTYIRALGNVGQQHILEAFEPYLEGQKQASHFQRVLMVVSLDKLARSNPKVARSVLYKIYQNPSEHEQVRVAAVYQLMRTSPPPSMLQRMASYTNVDPNHYVNSAVQSAIKSASQLKGSEQAKLRYAAQSAKHLLTSEQYGAQYSHQNLRSYVVEQMKLAYKQDFQSFGGADYIVPKGIKYTLESQVGGVHKQLFKMHAMVSSVEDLIYVYDQQTERYQKQKQEKQQHNANQNQWSSESIAKLLNMDYVQREQLEGVFHFHVGAFQKIWSFDNQTIDNLPQAVQELEQKLRNGQHYDYSKMIVGHETVVAFPTALGLPFIYTYDRPILVKYEVDIKASANPSVSTGEYLRKPDTVESEFEIRAFVSGRAQSQLGFITPFDHQRYSAGYDKNFQVIVPLTGTIQLDVQNQQYKVQMQFADKKDKVQLLHYSAWPYTAKNEIYSPEPEHQVIRKKHPQRINQVVGEKSTGFALDLEMTSDQRIDYASIYDNLRKQDMVSAILSPWVNEKIQFAQMNVALNLAQSTTKQIAVQVGYQHQYQPASSDSPKSKEFPEDPLKRQKEFMKRASSGIKNAHACVADVTVEFKGQQQIKYIATVAGAKSNADPKGRVLALFKKQDKQSQPLRFFLTADTHIPNTNGLNLDYAMQMDPTSRVQIEATLTGSDVQNSKINADAKFYKSEERKQYLKEQPEYQECQRQMQEGNKQLPICARVTAHANLLDQFKIKMSYDEIDSRIANHTYKLYSVLRHVFYPRIEENIIKDQSNMNNALEIQGHFHPDLKAVNFSVHCEYGDIEARNIKLNQWAKHLLVPHPVFHTRARLMGQAYKYDTYRPICVVDKKAAATFNNKTYPVSLQNDWTVLLQYVPRRPQSQKQHLPSNSAPEQLKENIESYVVYIRAAEQDSSKKELKMVVQTPGTQGKVVEIALKPKGSSQRPRLFVNKEEIKYDEQEAADIFDGYMQAYALPNNEVKLEIYNAYYVIYDGARVKLTVVDSKFRDASRGLCGTFTGEPETDFASPEDCILQDPEEFVKSYTVSQGPNQPHPKLLIRSMKNRADQEECYQKRVHAANYISAQDAGRSGSAEMNFDVLGGSSCTRHQTRYVVQGDETCFTLRPLPICKSNCRQMGTVSKNVPMHCVKSTSATNLWRNEINKGASPDFSAKSQSRILRMEVPQRCML